MRINKQDIRLLQEVIKPALLAEQKTQEAESWIERMRLWRSYRSLFRFRRYFGCSPSFLIANLAALELGDQDSLEEVLKRLPYLEKYRPDTIVQESKTLKRTISLEHAEILIRQVRYYHSAAGVYWMLVDLSESERLEELRQQ